MAALGLKICVSEAVFEMESTQLSPAARAFSLLTRPDIQHDVLGNYQHSNSVR
jgi:hypothetical protein